MGFSFGLASDLLSRAIAERFSLAQSCLLVAIPWAKRPHHLDYGPHASERMSIAVYTCNCESCRGKRIITTVRL